MKEKANELVETAKSMTTYGNWIFDFNELTVVYGVNENDYDELLTELQNHPDVLEAELDREEEVFNIYISGYLS